MTAGDGAVTSDDVSYFLMKNSKLTIGAAPNSRKAGNAPARVKDIESTILANVAALEAAAVVQSIGATPLVRLRRFERHLGLPGSIEIHLKTEWVNPGGSIKDRTARSIIRAAVASGELGLGQTLIDATSGNTGIAYAMLGAALDIPVSLVVPGSASEERKRTLAAYGARVIFSDPYEGSDGAIRLVRDMVAASDGEYFYADQYNNPANVAAHVTTTGPEIWSQTAGGLTHFVAALGTTGTLMGAGTFFRNHGSALRDGKTARQRDGRARGVGSVHLIGVQPAEAFHGIEGLKHLPTAIVPGIFDAALPDRIDGVTTEAAFDAARTLARVEGFFAGSSTGANLAAAARLGEELAQANEPAHIVVIGCDGGSRYLTTGLWESD